MMQQSIKIFAPIAGVYLIAVPAIQLYFYWGNFDIQPFEYISIVDSLSYSFGAFVMALLVLVPIAISISSNAKPDTLKNDSGEKWFPAGFPLLAIALLNIFIFLMEEIGEGIRGAFFWATFICILVCAIGASAEDNINSLLPYRPYRIFMVVFLSLSPPSAVYTSYLLASNILDKKAFSYIYGKDVRNNLESDNEILMYVGKLSGKYVFIRYSDDEVVMHDESSLKYFSLRKFNCKTPAVQISAIPSSVIEKVECKK
jgi:hypothetical protein